MSSDVLVSVVIPSYNCEKYIEQAILSVAFQTYRNIELIVVDDCSTDDSSALLKRCMEKYSSQFTDFVLAKSNKNMGAHYTINKCAELAKGTYIAILNADDLYMPDRIEVLLGAMQAQNARFAYSAVRCVDKDGLPFKEDSEFYSSALQFEALPTSNADTDFFAQRILGENVAVSTGNFMFEKSLFTQLSGFCAYKYVHDYDFLMRACLITEPIFVKHTAYLYRLHGQNSFASLAKVGLKENRVLWLLFYNLLNKGKLTNPKILNTPDYLQKLYQSVTALGAKKLTLWKWSKNPFIMVFVRLYRFFLIG